MTDGDSELSRSEEAQWDAIVSSEWPIESAILTTQLSGTSVPSNGASDTYGQLFVTVYQPRRPRLAPLAAGVLMLAASAWLTNKVLYPAYVRASLAGISRSDRAVDVHALTVGAVLVAITLVAAACCFGVWVIATARYRLRRSSCRLVASPPNPATVYVRPPNPASAATWILLLQGMTAATYWWISLQLERTSGSTVDAIEALHLAAVGGWAWLAALLLCAIGLTTWASREARHRLRSEANRPTRDSLREAR